MAGKIDNYGEHPTRYKDLTDDELYTKYRNSHWSALKNDERLDLLQETVNRSAAAHGEVGSCKVQWMNTDSFYSDGGTMGVQSNGIIRINEHYFANFNDLIDGEYVSDWISNTRVKDISSLKVLETVLHEDEHAYQNQVIHGVIKPHDPEAARQYKANDFPNADHGLAIVERPDGSLASGLQYISARRNGSQFNYYVYMAQSTERDAFRFSQQKTLDIIERQQVLISHELNELNNNTHFLHPIGSSMAEKNAEQEMRSFAQYKEDLYYHGYDAIMESAEELTHNPHFEEDVNNVLTNKYYGDNKPLHKPEMESLVSNEMYESYVNSRYSVQTIDHSQTTYTFQTLTSNEPHAEVVQKSFPVYTDVEHRIQASGQDTRMTKPQNQRVEQNQSNVSEQTAQSGVSHGSANSHDNSSNYHSRGMESGI